MEYIFADVMEVNEQSLIDKKKHIIKQSVAKPEHSDNIRLLKITKN